tara:strand:- start:1085 stop:1630 length:546 start_codon:yes stop_codon:yes gene_type:complete
MGRFYSGDIEGKFWFGIQDSNDIENLVTISEHIYYSWKACNCSADIDADNYCKFCYGNKEEHINDVKEMDEYDDECLFYEDNCAGYSLEKSIHYDELIENMNKLKQEIPSEIIESFDKIEQNDKILDAFTKVFDNSVDLINKITNKEEHRKISILVARYTLGYQIEYCLRKTESCHINCEY